MPGVLVSVTTRCLGVCRVVAALSALLTAAPGTAQEAAPEATIRTSVNLVLLDVGVWLKDGTPATGLKKENFEIWDNGVRRPITTFELGSRAISFALAVDYSRSMTPRKSHVIDASRHLVSRLAASDEIAILVFNDSVGVVQRPVLASELNESWLSTIAEAEPDGRTSLYDAIGRAGAMLSQARHERRVCIVLSDGKDTVSAMRAEDAMKLLQRANATVFTVGMFRPGEVDTDAGLLERLARDSGGLAYFDEDSTKLREALDRIVTGLRARYVLGFVVGETARGRIETHNLKLTVRDDKGRVLRTKTRRSYRTGGVN
jgi:VWFA-related protein